MAIVPPESLLWAKSRLHIALHAASSYQGAQFYISCAQVTVQGGSGSGKPGPLVAIPGVYTGNEPGILISAFILILHTRGPV